MHGERMQQSADESDADGSTGSSSEGGATHETADPSKTAAASAKYATTNRGKEFLVNGMRWNVDSDELETNENPSEKSNPSDSTSDSDEIDWKPMEMPGDPERLSRPMPKHTVDLTPAEAAFIARQQESKHQSANTDYQMDEEAWKRVDEFSATLPNFTIREEVRSILMRTNVCPRMRLYPRSLFAHIVVA